MEINKILRYLVIVGVFLIPFIALFVAKSMFFPFITGKNFSFRIIVEIVFAAWLLLALLDRSYLPKWSPVLVAYSIFIAVIAAADLLGVNPYKSFWSNYERMEGLVTHLHLFAYFIVATSVLATEKMWNAFWHTSLAASVIMGMYGLAQLAGKVEINQGGVRLDGTLGNAAYLAVYLLIHIFIAAYYMVRRTTPAFARYCYGAVMLLHTYLLYHTATRGTTIGLIAGAALASVLLGVAGRGNALYRKFGLGALAAIVLLVGGFLAARDAEFVRSSPVLSRFATISLTDIQKEPRFMVWTSAIEGFKERPVLGWGQENFNYVFNKYYDPRMFSQEPWFDRTHNIFFDWLIAAGLLGLLSYLSLFGIVVYAVWKSVSFSAAEKSVLTGLFAAYFIHNFFVFDNLISLILFVSLAAFLHVRYVEDATSGFVDRMLAKIGLGKGARTHVPVLSRDAALYGFAPVIVIALIGGLYYLNVRPIQANKALIGSIIDAQKPDLSLAHYRRAFDLRTFGSTEGWERMLGAAPSFASAPEEVRRDFVALAERESSRQLARTPNDARHLLFYGSYLGRIGRIDEALGILERARQNSPTKQQVLLEIANIHMTRKDYAKAFQTIKQAYDLSPEFKDLKIAYAIGAYFNNDAKLAESVLAEIPEDARLGDDRLLNMYAQLGRYEDVLAIWRARQAKDPGNPQTRLSIAATYLKLGQRNDAIRELEEIKKLNANYAEQIDFYIKEIREGRDPTQ